MEYALGAVCVFFLIFLLAESRRKAARILQAVAVEKSKIADDSGIRLSSTMMRLSNTFVSKRK